MFDTSRKSVQLLSYDDDHPKELRGSLIPRKGKGHHPLPQVRQTMLPMLVSGARTLFFLLLPLSAVFMLAVFATAGYGLVVEQQLAAAPVVTIVDPYTSERTELSYGPQIALSEPNFFIETRDSFIDEAFTFLEIDLSQKQVRYFEKGVLLSSKDILATGEKGSWWDTPAGLYQVERKQPRLFSSFAQVYLPSAITFGGNYMLHGWPEYPDSSTVKESFTGGGIRLSNDAIDDIYKAISVATPVLVHAERNLIDSCTYEPAVPGIDAPHYLIADVQNGTILAASTLEEEAPIASVTKLMTAVIAAEEINLDTRVKVTEPTFITSLIPRLSDRSSVSMYSLLQLLLVESSNEAAEVIASQLGRDVFIERMNEKALQLGMLHTHFSDPAGRNDDNVSTPGDLYRLTRYVYDTRRFIFEITAHEQMPSAYVGNEFADLINFNKIENLENFRGGKVGETTAAGQTSVSLHELQIQGETRTVMIVLLGSHERKEDVKALLAHVENNFSH